MKYAYSKFGQNNMQMRPFHKKFDKPFYTTVLVNPKIVILNTFSTFKNLHLRSFWYNFLGQDFFF